jgi:hypothetical protein
MKHFTLTRGFMSDFVTLGHLKADGQNHVPIHTLELPWKNNRREVSCIPTGVYRCVPHNGTLFKDVYRLEDVPNRTAILIHTGNTVLDIRGCILIGLNTGRMQDRPAVIESRDALRKFHELTDRKPFMLSVTQN